MMIIDLNFPRTKQLKTNTEFWGKLKVNSLTALMV